MEKEVKKILNILTDNGYEAYIIGGYVRDYLLGKKSKDIDICTNAMPEVVIKLCGGLTSNYGCVSIKLNSFNIDITTYREETIYNKRKPQIKYIDSLTKDLERRDFTINAICMDKDSNIIDELNGLKDLNAKLIRCIGDIDKKLREDPLRMLRAIRLATIFDFEISQDLEEGIKKYSNLVSSLSGFRKREELDKILQSKNYQKGLNLLEKLGLKNSLNLNWTKVKYVNSTEGMWAQIKVFDIPFTKEEKSNIIKIVDILKHGIIDNTSLYNYGLSINLTAGAILGYSNNKIHDMYNNLPIKKRQDIAISPSELEEIIKTNKYISRVYKEITEVILNGKLKNDKEDIKKYIEKRK